MKRHAMSLLAAAMLAACVATPQALTTPPAQPRARHDELLAYWSHLRTLPEATLAGEVLRQREALQKDDSDSARVRAALAIALAAPAEDGELAALVDPVVKRDDGDPDVKSVASFLQVIAVERRRQKESAAAAAARARDERRAAETQKQRADALQERATQLQHKLDALTEIEKNLSDRQGPSR